MSDAATPGCSKQALEDLQQQLLSSSVSALVALIPALASLLLAWISRLHKQRLSHSLTLRQKRLIIVAHVILLATTASFLAVLAFSVVHGFRPASDPLPSSTLTLLIVLLTCNAIAVLTFQTAGEGALLYQFLCLYPSTKARFAVVPLAMVFILARTVSQLANHVLRILTYAMPVSPRMPVWLDLQRQFVFVYTFSLMGIILLLSATFVFRLWTRWQRFCLGNRGRLHPNNPMQRIRNLLLASCHHTVLTSIAVVVMTATFLCALSNPTIRWINNFSHMAYKLTFSLGIAKSLFHLCFDPSTLVHESSGRHPRFQQHYPRCRCHRQAVPLVGIDIEGNDQHNSLPGASNADGVNRPLTFQYNSWDSGTLSMIRPPSDPGNTHCNCKWPMVTDSWPIISTSIETEPSSRAGPVASSSSRPSPSNASIHRPPTNAPNQLNLAAQTRHGPDAVINEFTHFVGYRFATRARFYPSAKIGSETSVTTQHDLGTNDLLALAICKCHSTMTELVVVPPDSPGSAESKACTLFVPIHFNGTKLGVLVCTPWNHPVRDLTGKHHQQCWAECCLTKSGSTASTPVEGIVQSIPRDRVHELLRRLSSFFAAYLHSAKRRLVNQETVRQFQHQLALVKATAQAKGTFLANMSHEIRTPAAQVIQAAHILSETQLDSVQQEHVEVILKSSEFLLAILNDILDLSKLESGKIRFESRPFDLHDAIRQSVDAYAGNRAKPLVDVGYVIDPDVPMTVVGDVVRFRQIWNNLLSNAAKFTESGSIILRAERVTGHHEAHRSGTDTAGESGQSWRAAVRFSVTDTGSGIPEDRLARIFERFEQSDETVTRLYGGTGLGLSISQSLCLLMRSSLHVTSTVGQGSTFSFEVDLPIIATPASESAALRLDPLTHRSIAIHAAANTDPNVARIGTIAQLLNNHRFDINQVHNPEVQVIVYDSDWPSLSDRIPKIPTIYISSAASQPPVCSHSHVAFVPRPFKQSHLFRTIDSLVDPNTVPGPNASHALLQPPPLPCVAHHDSKLSQAPTQPLLPSPPNAPPIFSILVVDDNPLNRRLLAAMLTRLGHAVEQATDGKEAVNRVLANDKPKLDCVFMDVRMPVMDGLEATRRIVRHYACHGAKEPRHRPVIIGLSADAMTEHEDEGLLNGMDKYLRKPVLKADLLAVLQDHVAEQSHKSHDA